MKLCVPAGGFLPFNDDPFNSLNLLPASQIQEEVDYCILNETCFEYLFSIYGGTDIRRLSIEVPQGLGEDVQEMNDRREQNIGDDAQEDKLPPPEHIVEIHLRRLKVHMVPQMSFYPSISTMPFTVYVSRTATVGELHLKISQSLYSHCDRKDFDRNVSFVQLVQWSRIWKVDSTKESIKEIHDQIYKTGGNP